MRLPSERLQGLAKRGRSLPWYFKFFLSGFFLAPTVTAGALKGAIFAANIYEACGFPVVPNGSESRHDIIQAVELGTAEGVIAFCPRYPGSSTGRQLRDTGAVGNAGL